MACLTTCVKGIHASAETFLLKPERLLTAVISIGRCNTFSFAQRMECMQKKQRRRRDFTTADKAELWDWYQRGESLNARFSG